MFSNRSRDSLKPLALMTAIVASVLCLYSCVAHAAGVAADPVAGAASAADTGWSLVTSYGPLWALALVVQGLGQTFLSRQHWLAQGRTLSLISGGVSTLGAVLAWHFSGAPIEGVVVTAIMALKLAWSPGVAGAVKPSGAGALSVVAILMLALAAPALTGCATVKSDAVAAEHAIVNCTAQQLGTTPGLDVATLVAIANVVATERAKCTPAGGSLDWHCALTDAIGEGKVLGGCSLVTLVTSTPRPATAVVAAATVDPGRAALEDFRVRVAEGATFHTSSGDL